MTTHDDAATRTAAARALVQRGHQDVARGAYREAIVAFSGALEVLRETLGTGHPEVEELGDDLTTVYEMAGVSDYLDVTKVRMPGDLPEPDRTDSDG